MKIIKRILKRYYALDIMLRASIWFIVANFFHKGMQFVVVPFYTRILSPEEYGEYTMFQSWLDIVILIATLNLVGAAFDKGLMKYKDKRDEFLSCMQGLSLSITVIIFSIWFCYRIFRTGHVVVIEHTKEMFLYCLFYPAFGFWSIRERYEKRYQKLVAITMGMSFFTPLVSLLCLIFIGKNAESLIIGYISIQVIVGLYFMIHGFFKGRVFFDKTYWKFAISFSIPLLPHFLSRVILNQADRVIIGWTGGNTYVAIYSIANNVSMFLNVIAAGINAVLTPFTYQALNDKDYKKLNHKVYTIFAIFAAFSVCLLFIVPEIVSILGTGEYYGAVWVVPPLMISTFLDFIISRYINVQYHYEEGKFVMFASVFAAVINVILNLLFVPRFGYVAAGYTTLVSVITWTFLSIEFTKYICREHGVPMVYNFKIVVILTLGLIVAAAGIMLLYQYRLIRYGMFGLGIIVCLAFVLMTDKKLI